MTLYVAGFAFNMAFDKVVLIRKNRPAWQAGLLNGVGGHVEAGETVQQAMGREFREEVDTGGVDVLDDIWRRFCCLNGSTFCVEMFAARLFCDVEKFGSATDEKVEIHNPWNLPKDTIRNTKWLVPMALDLWHDNKFEFAKVEYR